MHRHGGTCTLVSDISVCSGLQRQEESIAWDGVRCGVSLTEALKIYNQVRNSGRYNYAGVRVPLASGLKLEAWRKYELCHGDPLLNDLLEYGAPVGYEGTGVPASALINHRGALLFESEVDEYILSEVERGAMIGPFDGNPLPDIISVSPLNTVPKDGLERRIIVDFSFPEGHAVNDGIDKDFYLGEQVNMSFPSVDALAAQVRRKGRGCLLYKRDLRRAYRQFPIDPGDIRLLGVMWRGKIFLDMYLAMGLRSAAQVCQRVTTAVARIMEALGFVVANYLDDFAGCEIGLTAEEAFVCLGELLDELGLDESLKKAWSPATWMEFLGVLFDTIRLTLSITPQRLVEIEELVRQWLDKKSANRKQLESLVGKLQFVAKCVPAGRVFISRLLEQLRALTRKEHKFKVSSEMRKDLVWWLECMRCFNGVSIMLEEWWRKPDSVIATDACLTGGGGTLELSKEYFHVSLPEWVREEAGHINALEMWVLVVALKLWGHLCSGMRIKVLCDNEVTVWVINSGRSRDKVMLQLLRELCYWCVKFECQIRAVHLPGQENRGPDCLSRWAEEKKREEFWGLFGPEWSEVQVAPELFELSGLW